MKNLYNFKNLIARYNQGTIQALIKKDGYYDMRNGGEYVEAVAETVILRNASVVPLSNNDLKFDEAGFYNSDDAKLYCYKKLEKGTVIFYHNNNDEVREYTILQDKDYSDFDNNLHIYILRRVNRNDKDN